MSDLSNFFLRQLQSDLLLLADDACPIGSRLPEIAEQLEFVKQGRPEAISWDEEKSRFLIETDHGAVQKLLNSRARRRTDVVFFISTLATLLNRQDAAITDEHERAFHVRLLRFATENAQGSWSV